jgi:Tat protein secretion system quality control protein TatD with DNase activity
LIQAIPDNRILAESDLGEPVEAGKALERTYTMISTAKGWSEEVTRRRVEENTVEFLS